LLIFHVTAQDGRADILSMHGAEVQPVVEDTPRVLGCRMDSSGRSTGGQVGQAKPVRLPFTRLERRKSLTSGHGSVAASHTSGSVSQIQSGLTESVLLLSARAFLCSRRTPHLLL
jgi:hypothetical protein